MCTNPSEYPYETYHTTFSSYAESKRGKLRERSREEVRKMATPVGTGPIIQDGAPKGGFPKVRQPEYLVLSSSFVCDRTLVSFVCE